MRHFKTLLILVIVIGFGISAKLWFDFKNHPSAKDARKDTKIQIAEISNALKAFKIDCGRFPSDEEGIFALLNEPKTCKAWGPKLYLKEMPVDSWGNRFEYKLLRPDHFVVLSFGSDGERGGTGDAEDISSGD